MKKKQIFLFVVSMLLYTATFAQNSMVNVNTLTGAPNVVIPIDQVSRGQISVPINLVYSSSGIKPKDVEMTAGMGWQLQTGGQISRQVRGLPDDSKKDIAGTNISGWIYNSRQSTINGYNFQNDGTTCSNETADIAFVNTFTPDIDCEPDMFYVNAPGLSCQLVWDQSLATPGFRTIPYKDYVITPAFNVTTGAITSITIVNDAGITYVFGSPENVKQTTVKASDAPPTIFFGNTYNQYMAGINYNNNWHLTSVTDPNGNGVSLTYTTAATSRKSTDAIILWQGGANGAKTRISQYSILQTVTPQTLASIGAVDDDAYLELLSFTWQSSSTGQTILYSITGKGKTYMLTYSNVTFAGGAYLRSFLRSFSDYGCSSPVNYKFAYSGESVDSYGSTWSTILSDSTSTHIDYWGYFNSNASTDLVPAIYVNPSNTAYPRYAINTTAAPGSDYANSISGTNRSASPGAVAGSLTKIYYAQGGNSTIVYEPNDYLDVPSNTTVQGGGVRVKQLIDSAVNSPLAVMRNYSYKTTPFLPASASSGEPISLPQYAFTTPYTGTATGNDYWSFSTIRSETDLSPEDHTIMYNYVRESKTGAGSTLYQYYIPAGNWDNTAYPISCPGCTLDWTPTLSFAGRTDCAVSYGSVVSATKTYPFAPNPNYDFERGLPQKITNYDDENNEVSETNYTYQRTSTAPVMIRALAWDDNINSGRTIRAYSKYNIFLSTSELTSTVTKKVFDLPSLTTFQTSTTNNFYNTTQFKLIKQTATNSDGSIITNNIKYAKDFTTSGTNPDVVAISNLKAKNINIPIETYQQVTRGATTTTTAASLTRFQAVTTNAGTSYLPLQQLKFFSADGDPSFTPYSITSGVPASYSGYKPTVNFLKYDNYGNLVTTDDAHKHSGTVITNYYTNSPAATFSNAASTEVAFSDFDSYINQAVNFILSGTIVNVPGGHAGNAVNFITSQTFSKTLTKNAQTNSYIFSLWINAAAGSHSLTFTLSNGTPLTYTKTYTGTGAWKYYQFYIPVSTVASSFTVSITTNANIVVDDLLFYPENTEVSTYSYDPVTLFKTTETNTNGISAYYNYDQWGRLIYAYDQNKNIVQKNTYVIPADLQFASKPSIGYDGTRYVNTAVTFSTYGYNECTGFGISSRWNFGDGTVITTTNMSQSHTYTATGTYTVTLTTTSPVFGTKSTATTITITNIPTPPPGNITLSYTNHASSNGDITSVSFDDGVHSPIVVPVASLNGYVLPQGAYTIQVIFATGSSLYNGSTGYACIYVSGSCWSACKDYDVHNIYTYPSVNLSSCSTLNFSVNTVNCATLLQ
jgi:YD repeat-containing protein